jgi:TonB family protein
VVQQIQFRGLSSELQQRVQNRLTVRQGDTLNAEGQRLLNEELQQIDEHLVVNRTYDSQRANVSLFIMLQPAVAIATPVAPTPLPPGVFRIGGGVSAPVPTVRPEPEYSEEARAAKWQGAVLLQLVVDPSGVPQNIQVVRPLGLGLDQKAIEAVQKWRFRAGLKDGQPVPVMANIEVNFRLQESPEPVAAVGGSRPVTVGGKVMESRIIQKVPPEYPANAKTARVQGAVELSIVIGTDGKVQNAAILSGPPLLTQAALDAVSQWVYQPFMLNGQPVAVNSTVTVNFVLQ